MGFSTYPMGSLNFFLTGSSKTSIFVNTMNEKSQDPSQKLTAYQAERLKELIEEIIHCCQARLLFQSRKFDLTLAELRSLLLFKNEKYLTVKGISQELDVAKSRVTKITEGLLKKRLLQRIEDPQDGRIKLISLTADGQKKTEEIQSFIKEIHHYLLTNLKVEDRKAVLASLELLRSSMEVVKGKLV